jgi:hypothetical protein
MFEQIETVMKKAFWDLITEDVNAVPPRFHHIRILLNEIIDKLCSLIPNRLDLHEKLKIECSPDITWETQKVLLKWIEMLQSPSHDNITREMASHIDIAPFLKDYYAHLLIVEQHAKKSRDELNKAPSGQCGIPSQMKSGR